MRGIKIGLIIVLAALAVIFSYRPIQAGVLTILNSVRISSGLVGYWTLDGKNINWATGTVLDSSASGINGRLIAMSTSTAPLAGMVGQGLKFNGIDQFITVPSATNLQVQDITVSFWIKPGVQDSALVDPVDFSHDAGGQRNWTVLSQDATTDRNYIFAYHDGTAFRPTTAVGVGVQYTTGVWQHIVYTKSGTTVLGYKDGAVTWTPTPAGSATISYSAVLTFNIGSYVTDNSRNFNGEIDEVRVYDRALSSGEVQHLYRKNAKEFGSKSKTLNKNGLVGYWDFDDCDSCVSAQDRSPQNNPCTMVRDGTGNLNLHSGGFIQYGAQFNGSTDYIDCGASNELDVTNDKLTIMGWVNANPAALDVIGGTSYADVTNVGYVMFILANEFWCDISNAGGRLRMTTSSSGFVANKWFHVACVYDGANGYIYVNGVQRATAAKTGNIISTTNPFRMGVRPDVLNDSNFNGKMDEIYVFNRALSANEVVNYYESTKAGFSDSAALNASQNNKFTNGLVGMWSLNGPNVNWATGLVLDSTSTGNNPGIGNLATSTSVVPGIIGQALKFNGINQHLTKTTISGLPTGSQSFTISLWIYPTETASDTDTVFNFGTNAGSQSAHFIYRGSANILCFDRHGLGSVSCTTTGLTPGNWYHIVGTYNGSSMIMYANGVFQEETTGVTLNIGTGELNIGGWPANSLWFAGIVDEVRMYNRTLSTAEVFELYRSGRR